MKTCLKILMIVCNIAIFLGGAAILFIGGLFQFTKNNISELLGNNTMISQELTHLTKVGYLLIAIGGVTTCLGLLGCCGACCDNKCLLMIFFNIIFIVFVMEVIAAVLLLLKRPVAEKILEKISNKVVTSIKETYGQNYIITKAWNEMMNLMQCCGYNNYTDFQGTKFVNQTSLYPNFCCLNEQSLRCDSVKAESVGVNGCFKAVVNWVSSKATFLRGVAICVAAIQVAAMLVSLLLYKS
ncbi:tetraspanin-1-like isoform X2 [Silurus meridionalis]|uniref:Tetraspanin n=1 Tax=Silurus meridionalis TaxID=175797 RepID=A0A8T0AE89_SILME|nr:tetraspanin-1-like isoform X1 [Silurus meridionalis]XP_046693627.1 tetraspanin-1-like isoform X2 [Silurus meridionalis]KAF7689402.1 hypothetical protein HF521_012755 [Silurus meridionalis]